MDFSSFTPEQLIALKRQLDAITPQANGRTAEFRPRQLHNLTLPPTKDDARPLFVWSAEPPRDQPVGPGKPYPALVWHRETREERTIHSDAERQALGDAWTNMPAQYVAVNPLADLEAAMAGLTPEEREMIIQAQQDDRMARLQARLANLTEAQLEQLLGDAAPRKRGRPKKAVA